MDSTLFNGDVAFVVAKKATSPADVVNNLVECGLSLSSDTRAFAEEIFTRVPRKSSGVNVSFLLDILSMHILPSLMSICSLPLPF